MIRLITLIGVQAFFCVPLAAQPRLVTGVVTDENRRAIPGVNVVVKGASSGTISNVGGTFALEVPNEESILAFTFVGYTSVERKVGTSTVIDVMLEPMISLLSELVVVGYGVQKKKDLTGSVSIVDGSLLDDLPASQIENSFQGRLAGVTTISSGAPGVAPQVIIRGASTFAGSTQPLYVVDGVPTLDISTINPLDIESVTALKDAAAASIYGSRAGNGVILLTTKKGEPDNLKLTYSGYFGMQSPGKGITNLLDTKGMADLTWLAYKNSNRTPPSDMYGNGADPVIPDYYIPAGKSEGDPAVDPALYNIDPAKGDIYQITKANKTGTDWFDEITDDAPIQSHDLKISGGSSTSKYLVGLNYFDQQGTVIYTYAKRYALRINTEFAIHDKVRVGENLALSYNSNSFIAITENLETNSLTDCYIMPAILPVYDINGAFTPYRNFIPTPFARQWNTRDNKRYSARLFGNMYAEVDVLKSLTFRTSFGGSMGYGRAYAFIPKQSESNSFTEESFDRADWNWQNTLTYKKSSDAHSLTVLAGLEAIKTDLGRTIGGKRSDYYSEDPDYWTLNNGAAASQTNYGFSGTPSTLLGFFGRVDYSYLNRYLLSFTLRHDGSSKFMNNKFGTFPSATFAWHIGEERFLIPATFINELKLRVGYGIMGDQINASANNSYSLFIADPSNSYYDVEGRNTQSTVGISNSFAGNTEGQWQENTTANIGLDFALDNNKWIGSIDVYRKITDKLLYTSELPATNRAARPAARNVGKMENKGIDFTLNHRTQISRNWKLDAALTFTTYKNTVLKIANNVPYFDAGNTVNNVVRIQPGEAISSFYGYKVIGLWQSENEISGANALSPTGEFQHDASLGRFRYKDVNGDSIITPEDRTFVGNPNPDFTYGLNVAVFFRNFDFTIFLYGVHGNDVFNYTKRFTDSFGGEGSSKSTDLLLNSWREDNRAATIPIAEVGQNFSNGLVINSYPIEDGSYLRLKNIQLGYTFRLAGLTKAGIRSMRIYLQGTNLFTFTKYSGLDPEVSGSAISFGVDQSPYPAPKQFMVGLNVEL